MGSLPVYHLLRSKSQDYRLWAFRQVRKREVLPPGMEDADLAALAANLDAKPLDAWRREEFGHVGGLTAADAAQLADLKYYHGDLQRELDHPMTTRVSAGWRENLHVARDGLEAREHDDFFSTMFLGTQPQRTCLSYIDGQYRQCLLSAFDSNKKILYSFFFREYRNGQACMCGGLILHSQEDMGKAYYGIHT